MISDKELISVVQYFRDGLLDGRDSTAMCYAICLPLCTLLDVFHDLKCELVETDYGEGNHYWLRMPDGRVLDPTCDQFNDELPSVYLGEPLTEIHG